MWDLPGPGLEPVSPALAGGFLTTVPPGKSPHVNFKSLGCLILQILPHNLNSISSVFDVLKMCFPPWLL